MITELLERDKVLNVKGVFQPIILVPERSTPNRPVFDIVQKPFLINTEEYSRTAKYFEKNKVYTTAHPVYDRYEYELFWDEEERRCIEGYSVGGVAITGEHYAFLNFGRILLIDEITDSGLLEAIGLGALNINTASKNVGFPSFRDGQYYYYHAKRIARLVGKNMITDKSRRSGWSYIESFGANYNYQFFPNLTTVIGAANTTYLSKGDGTFMMTKNYINWFDLNTAWKKARLINQPLHLKSGFKLPGDDIEYGYKSQIIGVSFLNAPAAAAGKDAYEVKVEEGELLDNLKQVLDITQPTMEVGGTTTGMLNVWGTAGDESANWQDFEDIYYNPTGYNFLEFVNKFDKESEDNTCGYFYSYIRTKEQFIKNGNTDMDLGMKESLRERKEKEKNFGDDVDGYNNWVAQRCLYPAESFNRSGSNFFSELKLDDRINFLIKSHITNKALYGIFVKENGKVRFVQNEELKATGQSHRVHSFITDFPLTKRNQDLEGCWMMIQPPFRRPDLTVPGSLYRLWADPFSVETIETGIKSSLGYVVVYEKDNAFTPTRGGVPVAYFASRPKDADFYDEQLLLATEYYNGIVQFENDTGTIKQTFKKAKKLDLLSDEPEFNFKKELTGKGGRGKGMSMNHPKRKTSAAIYLLQYLKRERGLDNEENVLTSLDYIYDIAFLKELKKWNLKGNFDRVSTFLIGVLDIEESFFRAVEDVNSVNAEDFFSGNFFN